MLLTMSQAGSAELPYSWHAADRAAKVMRLIPGQAVRDLTPETLFAAWTAAQIGIPRIPGT